MSEPLTIVKGTWSLSITLVTTRSEMIVLFRESEPVAASVPDEKCLKTLGVTKREAEVLLWIACGKTNGDIGVILGIAVRTVKKHLEHIFEKLGVENRTTAAARAMETLRVDTTRPSRSVPPGVVKPRRSAR